MDILLSNDDGVLAPGLLALRDSLSTIASVKVIAPDRNRSGASNSLTLSRPLRIKLLENGSYSVEGTPTDCVHLALTGYFKTKFDIVVSGINHGANLGDDILYSGTVAAAMEGRFLGLPAIAVSVVGQEIHHFAAAAEITKQLVLKLSTHQLPAQSILNVNVPDLPLHKIKGILVTRLGSRHLAEPLIKSYDPRGRDLYWIGPPGAAADSGPGTDFEAVKQGYVSITPLQLDMTHYAIFDQVANWTKELKW